MVGALCIALSTFELKDLLNDELLGKFSTFAMEIFIT